MASQRTLRNGTVIATVLAFLITASIIVWDAIRPLPIAERSEIVLAGKKPIDTAAVEQLVQHPTFLGLVELAPPPTPTLSGNRNPFFAVDKE